MTKKTKAKRKSVSKKKTDLVHDPSEAGDVTNQAQILDALRESEELYRSIFELSPDGIITVNLKGIVTTCNPTFLELTGYSEDEIIGKHFTKFPTLRAKDIPRYTKVFASLIRGKIPKSLEIKWLHKNGSTRHGNIRVSLLKKNGKIIGIQVIARDITEQKLDEEVLKTLSKIVEQSTDSIITTDTEFRITYLNLASQELYGWSLDEVKGKTPDIFNAELMAEEYQKEIYQTVASGNVFTGEALNVRKDGSTFICQMEISPIRDDKGDISGYLGSRTDITERKQAEEALKEEKAFTETALNSQIDTFYVFRVDNYEPVRWNSALEEVSGYSSEEISSMVPLDFYPESEHEAMKEATQKILKTGRTTIELTGTTKDGRLIPYEYVAALIKDEKGDPLYICSIGRDISERKQAEEALLARDRRLQSFFDNAAIGIAIADPKGQYQQVNHHYLDMFGYESEEELFQKTIGKVTHPEDRETTREAQVKLATGEIDFFRDEKRYLRKDGSFFWGDVSVSPIKDVDGEINAFTAIIVDITERKQAEEALVESEERLRTLSEATFEGVAITEKGVVLDANQQMVSILGCTLDELIGVEASKFVAPEDLEFVRSKILDGIEEPYEHRALRKDGSVIFVEVRPRMMEINGKPVRVTAIRDITERKQAEEALSEANNIINRSPAVACLWENEEGWPVEFVSENVENLCGYSAQEFLERKVSYSEIIHSDDLERVAGEVDRYSKKKGLKTFSHEPYRIVTKNGDIKWIDDITYIRRDSQGQITHYEGIIYDITERKKAEEALRESEERYRSIYENIEDVIYETDFNGHLTGISPSIEKQSGYRPEELIGQTVMDFFPYVNEYTALDAALEAEGTVNDFEIHLKKKSGEITIVSITAHVVFDSDGQPVKTEGVLRDINERKQGEKALQESEEKYRNLVERANDGVIVVQEGIVKFVNSRMAEMFGYTVDEMLNTSDLDYIFPDERPKIMEIQKRRTEGKDAPKIYEIVGLHRDGSGILIEINTGIISFQGKSATFSFVRDITERKQAEAQLKLQSLALESAANAIVITDAEGNIQWANPAFSTLTGYPVEEVLKQNPSILKSGQQDDAFYKNMWDTIAAGEVWHGEITNKRKDGELYTEEMTIAPLLSDEGEISNFIAIKQDITERKQAEKEKENLLASENLQRTMAETLSEVTLALTSQTSVLPVLEEILIQIRRIVSYETANIALLEDDVLKIKTWYGYEAFGSAEFISNLTHMTSNFPIDNEVVRSRQPRVIPDVSKEPGWQEIKETNWIKSYLLIPICLQDRVLGLIRIDGTEIGKFSEEDAERLLPLASSAAVALENASLYEQAQQELIERERAEKEIQSLNEELEQRVIDRTTKLKTTNEELEAFSYSISHDLRAPLRAINGFSAILKENYGELLDEEGNRYLDILRTSTLKMDRLINDLLSLSRMGRREISFQPVNITAMVERIYAEQTKDESDRGFDFQVADCPIVEADTQLLEILLTNLLSNAVKFTRGRNPAVIEFGRLGEEDAPVYFFKDNGVGFNMAYVDKLFGPFQRLHSEKEFEGTGIGLAIVRRIAQRHGGRVWVEAEPDKGATFYFTLGKITV